MVMIEDNDKFDLERIGERLARQGRLDSLQILAAKAESFDEILRPHLAKLGDERSLGALLQMLRTDLTAHVKTERNSLEWLSGASDSSYLDDLFECLALARSFEEDPFGAAGMLESAIAAIGGEPAIGGYDRMIANRPFAGAQFMRLHRDRLAQIELQRKGDERVDQLARQVGVPLLAREQ